VSAVIRWEDPPREHGNACPNRPSKYDAMATALRSRPDEWAVVVENGSPGLASSLAYLIRAGFGPFAPVHSFEVKVVGPGGSSSYTVYARYGGEVSGASSG
jgi:hypothetical protein